MRSAYRREGARGLATPRRRWTALALLAVSVVVLLGFGWYVSERVADGALRPRDLPRAQTMTVVATGGGTITLQAGGDDNWRRGGLWGLEWSSGPQRGYARVAAPVAIDEQRREVKRSLLAGDSPPLGASARLDNRVYAGTPSVRGLAFEDVRYPADRGATPAWLVPGSRSTWVIYVHGRGAGREEGLRFLPIFEALDLPTLVISYRNDKEAPGGASEHYAYGRTEWRDVEAAVGWARAAGAADVVLMGSSMGGGIVLSFLYRSELASVVRGAILDAPMLRFDTTVDFGLAEGGVPGFYRWLPMWIAAQRFEIDWDQLDYLGRAQELRAPLLLIHGSDDDIIPVELSDELARARPDLVTYERFEGAHHVASWNIDPVRYEAAVVAFLASVAPRPRSSQRTVAEVARGTGAGATAHAAHHIETARRP